MTTEQKLLFYKYYTEYSGKPEEEHKL